jgi:hypothetical protein
MRQAVGQRGNQLARVPSALRWADMMQAVGLGTTRNMKFFESVWRQAWVMTDAEALGYFQSSLRDEDH